VIAHHVSPLSPITMPLRSVSRSEGVVNQPPRHLVRRLLFRTLPVAASLSLLACADVDPTLNSSGIPA
jgi:hypothetical protein